MLLIFVICFHYDVLDGSCDTKFLFLSECIFGNTGALHAVAHNLNSRLTLVP